MMLEEIKRVQRAARQLAIAQKKLDESMLVAHEAGASLRKIASAAEVSVETTRTRIKRASQSRDALTTAKEQ